MIINDALPAGDHSLLLKIAVVLGAAMLISLVVSYGEFLYSATTRERMVLEIQRDVLDHVLRLPVSFFKEHEDGYVMSRILSDADRAVAFTAEIAAQGRSVVWLLTATVLVPSFHLMIGLVVIAIIPAYVAILVIFNERIRTQFHDVQEKTAKSSRELHQALAGVLETKAYCAEKYRTRRYVRACIHRARSLIWGRQLMALGEYSTQLVMLVISLFILVYGGFEVIKGRLTLGELVALNALAAYVLGPVKQMVTLTFLGQQSLAAIERLNELLTIDPEGGRVCKQRLPSSIRGHISYRNVVFGYNPERPIIKGVSFDVNPGETALLAGHSGIGKTTLVALLPRFFDPQHGKILIDGYPVDALDLRSLRQQIGFVSQDVYLFSDSIYNNIRMGKPSASRSEVLEAAKLANVIEFAERMEDGLNTKVGDRGCRLSGGQRQRISIARAILKDSSILVLDEASSAVDGETETALHEAIAGLLRKRTTIIIAHHATNFLHQVDRTFLFDNGGFVSPQT